MLCVLNLIEQLGSVTKNVIKTQGMMHKGRYTLKKYKHKSWSVVSHSNFHPQLYIYVYT
jgi:hypothetical protein